MPIQPNNPVVNDPNANAVPPQNSTPPVSMPAPPPPVADSSTSAPAALPTVPGNTPAALPTVTPGQTMPDNTHRTVIGKVMQDIAGGKTTDYLKTPSGPVAVKRNLAPGEMARNILASAFSLLAAGTGGELAAKEGRPYKQPEDQTIGGMEENRVAGRQQEAQNEFNNQNTATELQRQQAADAREQQLAIARLQNYTDSHERAQQALQAGLETEHENSFNNLVKNATFYNQAMAMPGAQIMKDGSGKELNFYDIGTPGQPGYVSAGSQLQKYAIDHPEVLHGSTDGTSRYGVIPVTNPYTGAVQLVDYPADRHTAGLEYVGAKRDKNGNVMFDKNDQPIPDGSILDPVTHKPTVLAEPVNADQARAIKAQNLTEANTRSEIADREAQRRQREAAIAKNQDLQNALEVYADGAGINKMTAPQRKMVGAMLFQQTVLMSNRERQARADYMRASNNGTNDDSDAAKEAKANLNEAETDYNDTLSQYRLVSGISAGTMFGNRQIALAGQNPDWSSIDSNIKAAVANGTITAEDGNQARVAAWNRLTPQQQAAARAATQSGAKPAAAPVATAAPAAKPKPGTVSVIDPAGIIRAIPNDQVAAALKAGGRLAQ